MREPFGAFLFLKEAINTNTILWVEIISFWEKLFFLYIFLSFEKGINKNKYSFNHKIKTNKYILLFLSSKIIVIILNYNY